MGKNVKNFIYFLKFWIYTSPVIAGLYLLLWVIQVFAHSLFVKLNFLFGYIPSLIDKLIPTTTDINGMDVPMGYVYLSTFIIVSTLGAIKLENHIIDSYNEKEHKISEGNLRRRFLRQKQRMGEKNIIVEPSACFFGLLEMKFDNLEGFDKSFEDLDKLKREYSKLLINKLKEKYPDIQFILTGKIFIICDEFTIFDNFLNDVIRCFSVFQEINNEKYISSGIILSFEAGDSKTNSKYIYRFLSKINDLEHVNKVIILEKFAKKYKYVLTKQYISVPLGMQRVEIDNSEIDVDLFYLENE